MLIATKRHDNNEKGFVLNFMIVIYNNNNNQLEFKDCINVNYQSLYIIVFINRWNDNTEDNLTNTGLLFDSYNILYNNII